MDKNDKFISDFINLIGDTSGNSNSTNGRSTKPYSPSSGTVVQSRYEYMKLVLSNIVYSNALGENYTNSYRSVIQFYMDKVEVHKADLNYLENGIRKDISMFKENYKTTHRRSTLGQIHALEFVLNELLYSKHQMMNRVSNNLVI